MKPAYKVIGARRAFSLLELVVAVVLMALLAVTTTTVLRSIIRQEKKSEREFLSALGSKLIRRDLSNASEYMILENQLYLRGPLASDEVTKEASWRDAEVSYQIQQISGFKGRILVRLEQTNARGKPRRDPIWVGASSLAFSTTYLDDRPASVGEQPLVSEESWLEIPPSFQVSVTDEFGETIFSEFVQKGPS